MFEIQVMTPLSREWKTMECLDTQKEALHRMGDYLESGGKRIKTLLPNREYTRQISGPYWAKYKVVPVGDK